MVNAHRRTWNAPTFARKDRNCCWPAPQTSFTSWNTCSMAARSEIRPRTSAAVAAGSVQKYATQPASGFRTSTTRMAPPAGGQVARNVLYVTSSYRP